MIQIGDSAATIDAPVEHLMACHRRIEQRLDALVNAADHLRSNPVTAMDAIRNSLQFLDTSGVNHTRDEEVSLFPRLRPKVSASEIDFLGSLESQHVEADEIHTELSQTVAELGLQATCAADLIETYRVQAERLRLLYREHIRTEDQILTSMAKRVLSDVEILEIAQEMRDRRESPKK